ncbi:hypothetical protein F5X99DRAFT_408457 [Biscogniauxia marginata]|nr:hypothetical protein F5X99DRAFT_408457 [Biscogniauxia marginata]
MGDPLPRLVTLFRRGADLDAQDDESQCMQCQTKTNQGTLQLITAVDHAPKDLVTCFVLQYLAITVFSAYGSRPEEDSSIPWVAILCELERTLYARGAEARLSELLERIHSEFDRNWTANVDHSWTANIIQGIAFAAMEEYEWQIAQGHVWDPRDPKNREHLTVPQVRLGHLYKMAAHMETVDDLEKFLFFLRERWDQRHNFGILSPGRLDELFLQICPDHDTGKSIS